MTRKPMKRNEPCADCGAEMSMADTALVARSVRLGPWELQLRKWGTRGVCFDCADDKRDRQFDAAYDAGGQKGYEEGYRAAEEKFRHDF